jgi:putative SOS response-associated peptidase YedK
MCGRFTVVKSSDNIEARFNVKIDDNIYQKRYNASPSQNLPIITNQDTSTVQFYKWGLIPFWAKNPRYSSKLINARAETLTEKPSFKYAIEKRRCLVIADGYYEWKNTPEGKVPYRITLPNDQLFAFAGIWESWKNQGDVINTFSIITVNTNSKLNWIHHRMPAILTQENEKDWLSNIPINSAIEMLTPYQSEDIAFQKVSTLVNSVKNDSHKIIS